jgi:hypothetical protein
VEETLKHGRNVLLVIVFAVVLTLVTVAENAYPQGESYPTGRWIARDVGPDRPEYAQTPSPSSNPTWVRVSQNNDWIILVAIIGLLFNVVAITNKEKP